jgi:hypothetical protein
LLLLLFSVMHEAHASDRKATNKGYFILLWWKLLISCVEKKIAGAF